MEVDSHGARVELVENLTLMLRDILFGVDAVEPNDGLSLSHQLPISGLPGAYHLRPGGRPVGRAR